MDNSGNFWDYTNQLTRSSYGLNEDQSDRLNNKLSNLVGNWSIAPPNLDMNYQHPFVKSEDFCYNQLLVESSNIGYHHNSGALGGLMMNHGDDRCISGMQLPSTFENPRAFLKLNESLTDDVRPSLKAVSLSDFKKKKELQTSFPKTANEGKNKRCEEMADEVSKKAKSGSSTVSQAKESPKAKIRDKIITLQQIVSPFGKADTASVIQEAITYIKFCQEQVKLLSTPYMKNSSLKDPWGEWKRKDSKGERTITKYIDLRSRGLCLVPISCTPLAYRETTGADHRTPNYRAGCSYH